jgi:hypothetical protein
MKQILLLSFVLSFISSCGNKTEKYQNESETLESPKIETRLNLVPIQLSNQNNPKRVFSLTNPAIDDVEILFFWKENNGIGKKQLYFKSDSKEYVLDEIFNRVINTDINGARIQAYDEVSVFSNDRYNIIISSTPESASLVYWSADIKVFSVGSNQLIFDERLYAEEK